MNKKELDILEKAFEAQIASSFNNKLFPIIQTKSKIARKLRDDGYLQEVSIQHGYVTITGYALTMRGNFAYCDSDRCRDAVDD